MDLEESEKIRRRLHDGLCQQLTAALMFAEAQRRSVSLGETPLLADSEQLVQILHQSADELIRVMDLVAEGADPAVSSPLRAP